MPLRKFWRVFYVDLGVKPALVHTFSIADGTPAQAQAYQDHGALCVFQTTEGGRATERIALANKYVHLTVQDQWCESTQEEIDEFAADGIELTAIINGGNLPRDIFQAAMAWVEGDRDFPVPAGPEDYEIGERQRFEPGKVKTMRLRQGATIRSGPKRL